jgi:hypothetical protein
MTKLIGELVPDEIEQYRMCVNYLAYALQEYDQNIAQDLIHRYHFELLQLEPGLGNMSKTVVTPQLLLDQGRKKWVQVSYSAKLLMKLTKTDSVSQARHTAQGLVQAFGVFTLYENIRAAIVSNDVFSLTEYCTKMGEKPNSMTESLATSARDRAYATFVELFNAAGIRDSLSFNWNTATTSKIIVP